MAQKKQRLDVLMAARGLAPSREQAQRLILAGAVLVNGQSAFKAGQSFDEAAAIEVAAGPRFVGRGGEKLAAAFERFGLDVRGLVCVDVGASTGGFTDCLLQHGALRVYAVDVGHGQLDWRLRQDSRVVVHEGVNARQLDAALFPVPPAFGVVDVSFISLTLVLPAVTSVLTPGAGLVTLIKPQFEAGRDEVGRGGVVRDEGVRCATIERVRAALTARLPLVWMDGMDCPVHGPAGNIEYLAYWRVKQ
jgi:23S rRNA (cytidine1920-2'-O)/16S rRNA (cytidine1409-2'-O)-methyltransferase